MPEREPQNINEQILPTQSNKLSFIENFRLTSTVSSLKHKKYLSDSQKEKFMRKLISFGEPAFDQLSELFEAGYDNSTPQHVALEAALEIDKEKSARKLLQLVNEKSGRLPHNTFEIVVDTLPPEETVAVLNSYLALRYSNDYKKPKDGGGVYDLSVQCAQALATIADSSSIEPLKNLILGKSLDHLMPVPAREEATVYLVSLAKINENAAYETVVEFITQQSSQQYTVFSDEFIPVGVLGYPVFKYLVNHYHQMKHKDEKKDKHFRNYIKALIPLAVGENLEPEKKLDLISKDQNMLDLFTDARLIQINELKDNEDVDYLKQKIFSNFDWKLARNVGLSPAESVLEFYKIKIDKEDSSRNYDRTHAIEIECKRIEDTNLQDQSIEVLEDLLEISIRFDKVPLTFKLIDSGLPIWESLEKAEKGPDDLVSLDSVYYSYYNHLKHLKENRSDLMQQLTGEQQNYVSIKLFEKDLLDRIKYSNLNYLHKDYIEYIYENPNPIYADYLVNQLRATQTVTSESSGPDPDWQPVIYHSYQVPDEDSRQLAFEHLTKIPWVSVDTLQKYIDDLKYQDIEDELIQVAKKLKK